MPKELFAHLDHEGGQLTPIERANIRFSLDIRAKLKRKLPNLGEIPLVYIGSGGDLITALLVSGAKKIILIDSHPFLTKSEKNDSVDLFESVDDLIRSSKSGVSKVGLLTIWSSVRPGEQMLTHLRKMNIPASAVRIHSDGYDASIEITIGDQVVEIQYLSSTVNTPAELGQVLDSFGIAGDFGILTKGGATNVLPILTSFDAKLDGVLPRYFVADDPRFEMDAALTQQDEQTIFVDYDLEEQMTKQDIGWGYSYNEEPGSTAGREGDYRARAVVGLLAE